MRSLSTEKINLIHILLQVSIDKILYSKYLSIPKYSISEKFIELNDGQRLELSFSAEQITYLDTKENNAT